MRYVLGWFGAGVAVVVIGWALWHGLWAANRSAVQHTYEINRDSQQFQAGLISQERNLSLDWNRAIDPGQKRAIADQFCQIYPNLQPATADLASVHDSICN